jgi:hypothetical protein
MMQLSGCYAALLAKLSPCVRFWRIPVFTVDLPDRRQTLLIDHIVDLREAVAATRQTRRFEIAAFVMDARNCSKILGEKRGLFGVTGRRYSIFP